MQQPYCIFVSGARNITVRHNDITNVPYSGIRVWGHFNSSSANTAAFDSGAAAVFNISGNHVHEIGMSLLSDFGGIFVTTRPAHGSNDCVAGYGDNSCNVLALVAGNSVHSVRHHDHGGAGIYTDESSGRTNVTDNLVFNCSGWGLHLHCGWKHVVVNNLFAGNTAVAPAPFAAYEKSDYAAEPWCNFHSHNTSSQGFSLWRNIFDQAVAPQVGVGRPVPIFNNAPSTAPSTYGNISNVLVNTTLDMNLYTCADGDSCGCNFPRNRSLAAWQAWGGKDAHSVGGLPGYLPDLREALAIRRDFRVDPGRSAAVSHIGFKPLPLQQVGPRPDVQRLVACHNNGGDAGVWWRGCAVGALRS